jgi:hypothetical protein
MQQAHGDSLGKIGQGAGGVTGARALGKVPGGALHYCSPLIIDCVLLFIPHWFRKEFVGVGFARNVVITL